MFAIVHLLLKIIIIVQTGFRMIACGCFYCEDCYLDACKLNSW